MEKRLNRSRCRWEAVLCEPNGVSGSHLANTIERSVESGDAACCHCCLSCSTTNFNGVRPRDTSRQTNQQTYSSQYFALLTEQSKHRHTIISCGYCARLNHIAKASTVGAAVDDGVSVFTLLRQECKVL